MNLLVQTWDLLMANPARFGAALWTHVLLSAMALLAGALVAVPLGVRLALSNRHALLAINLANVGRTLPSLAVLALAMPLLGTGFVPSLFALALLALPPILLNTYTGVRGVDPDVIDAARGMGMREGEITRRVRLQLALPLIFSGLRTAAAQVISGATLAAYIGGGGLGEFITSGVAMMAIPQLLLGAIPATLLAIGVDALFGRLQKTMTPRGLLTS